MEEILREVALKVALTVEAVAVLVIAYGAAEAAVKLVVRRVREGEAKPRRKQVWLGFGVWLLLGLEFELAADIVRSVISPSWTDIGQLGAIAVIRTFLNYFLEKDLEKYEMPEAAPKRKG
ncbi:MAG TPA: DUF1622 domain-containing protein [Gemmatimonadales bacterium]|nr:DUF1622 domain-containing protein [Gemmatimonadales bacterium]